jgi:hypothetical protein
MLAAAPAANARPGIRRARSAQGRSVVLDTEMFIRQRTELTRLDTGAWRAEFPGKHWHVVVTAPTAEQARAEVLADLDARVFAMLCDDLGLSLEDRPPAYLQSLRRTLGKGNGGPRPT